MREQGLRATSGAQLLQARRATNTMEKKAGAPPIVIELMTLYEQA
jgi:hypothetical protein